jgi:hypothetical protein
LNSLYSIDTDVAMHLYWFILVFILEGLEGYVSDFNAMVKELRVVTGDSGIEVLPVAPVVYDGIDDVGKTLMAGVREWIKWIGDKSGRVEIGELSETGGREVEEGGEERVI